MQESGKGSWLIVGLGNPGAKYANNRHNIGRIAISALAQEHGGKLTRHRSGAYLANVRLGVLPGGRPGPQVMIAYPDTFMNVSGGPVGQLLKFYNITADHLLVIHDELDLPAHELRLKRGGGEGGHNGLRSISQHTGTRDYARLRVGVGRPPGRMDPADFVLSDFPKKELNDWAVTVNQAVEVVQDVVTAGFSDAQQKLHTAN